MRRAFWITMMMALVGLAGCVEEGEEPADEEPDVEAPHVAEEVAALHESLDTAVPEGAPVTIDAKPVYDLNPGIRPEAPVAYDVILEESSFLSPELWIEAPERAGHLDGLRLFEGHVAGEEDQLVRLSVSNEWARGTIRIGDMNHFIRYGLDGNLPVDAEPPGGYQPMTNDWSVPLAFDPPAEYYDHDCLSLAPTDLTPVVELGRSGQGELVADLILDGDAAMMNQLHKHTLPMMVAMMFEADGIYDYETGIRFQIVGMHVHEEWAMDVGGTDVFAPVRDYWNVRNETRDIVHVFTGTPSDFAQANCIGGAGIPSEAYTFTPISWARNYEAFHLTALAHELGHIFNAHHHYGNHVEANQELATLMIQGYTPGINPVFSTVSKTTIRGWADAHID